MPGDYAQTTIVLPTKHAKSIAVARAFLTHLQASVLEFVVDTDLLGTFSGEIERQGNTLDCARRKCEWAMELLGNRADYLLSSEGSFGPHPAIPFIAADHEILYFVDRKRGFHLHLASLSEKTNYQMQVIHNLDELKAFAVSAGFPSHALMLRPQGRSSRKTIVKGITDEAQLVANFKRAQHTSPDDSVLIETDMRAHLNPTRMTVIAELAEQMAKRLATRCPSCWAPGWGINRGERGLPCSHCTAPTQLIVHEIHGCTRCTHEVILPRPDGLLSAPQMWCQMCNP
jgi:hypothetical protein